MSLRRLVAIVVLALSVPTASAIAQPIGTFRWQLQPFCNVLTVNVTQQGGIYTLDGTDDRCGGGNQAGSAVGIAYLTPLGLVGFGITTVLPGGTPVHTEATISIASLNGTWRDSAGNNGTFTFTPGTGTGGSPRTVSTTGLAAASITNVLIAPNAVNSTNIVNGSITTADLAAPPLASFAGADANIALTSAPQTVQSLAVSAPGVGRVVVTATGYFSFNTNAASDGGRCSITNGATTIDFSALTIANDTATVTLPFFPFSLTRGFNVAAGSNTTFRLVCELFSGSVDARDPYMTAVFIPGP